VKRRGPGRRSFTVVIGQTNSTTTATTLDAAESELRLRLCGGLYEHGDPEYADTCRLFNSMIERRPRFVAHCAAPDDVIASLAFARDHGLEVAVRAGGHSVTGRSLCDDGLVLDLRGMRDVEVDPDRRVARVGGGATWADVDRATQAHGLATTGGRVSTTGVGGLTLGGGSGWLERKHGLACDNLVAAELVTADGELVRASEEENPDLLWALRGGGGGLGVVTALEFRLHPVGPQVMAGLVLHPAERAPELLRLFRDVMRHAPDELGLAFAFITAPAEPEVPAELHGMPAVVVAGMYAGTVDEGEDALRAIRELGPPAADFFEPTAYADFQCSLDDPPGYRNYWTAENVADLPDEAVDALVARAADIPPGPSQLFIVPWGGAVPRFGPEHSPLGGREARFIVHPLLLWEDPADDARCRALGRAIRDDMRPWSVGATYPNFLGDEGPARMRAAFGASAERLGEVKDRWDPRGTFRAHQALRLDASTDHAAALGEHLTRGVVGPDHPEYGTARRVWNGMIDRRPAVIARCAGAGDVAVAVRFAVDRDLPIAVRGGGHNVAGTGVADDALVIDLSPMRDVRLGESGRTVHVQGGATWADVDRVTAPLGLAAPGGVVSETGVAGLALSGGVSHQRRRDGMTVDNLVSAEVVLADGRRVRASAGEHPDLYWALRGGGGNFGVVTSFELRLHELGPEVFALNVAYPLEDAKRVLAGWRDAVAGAPDELSTAGMIWSLPVIEELPEQLRGLPYVGVAGMWAGDPAEGERATRQLRELATPLIDMSGRMEYLDYQASLDPFFPAGARRYWKALYLDGFADAAVDTTVEWSERRPSNDTLVIVRHCGGAIARVGAEETAFGDRSSEWMLSIDSTWHDPADDATNIGYTRAFWDATLPFSDGKTYFNFPGLLEEGETAVRSSYGANHERLARIKAAYDPDNRFRINANIEPRGEL
jgi:FAD/FMN-containing dehydrogenase